MPLQQRRSTTNQAHPRRLEEACCWQAEGGHPSLLLGTSGTHLESGSLVHEGLKGVLQLTSKMGKGLERLSHKERLRELGLLRLEKRWLRAQANRRALNTWPSNLSFLED